MSAIESNDLLPLFLKLDDRTVLVVGGGEVALQKIAAIIDNAPAASIIVVAAAIGDGVRAIARNNNRLMLIEREYRPSDIDRVDLVIAAVNDTRAGETIHADARERGKLVNVVDTPHLCDFYFGSVVRKGNLKIAISTNGRSPTLARRLRELLSEAFPEEIDELLGSLHRIRARLKGDFAAKVRRLNEITAVLASKQEP